MMKEQLFVIGDIHGEYEMLQELLSYWDKETQQLVFIGDLGDRGNASSSCFKRVHQLVKDEDAICITGNHEQILLNFLNKPDEYAANYFLNGGLKTIESFLSETDLSKLQPEQMAKQIQEKAPWLKSFLTNLPNYYEWYAYLFVHAGVNLTKESWLNTSSYDFIWIREPFHNGRNRTGKTIIFGHTPTNLLHGDMKNFQIWEDDNKIGIDGGAVFGGILHGLVFDKNGMIHHYGVQKKNDKEVITKTYQ